MVPWALSDIMPEQKARSNSRTLLGMTPNPNSKWNDNSSLPRPSHFHSLSWSSILPTPIPHHSLWHINLSCEFSCDVVTSWHRAWHVAGEGIGALKSEIMRFLSQKQREMRGRVRRLDIWKKRSKSRKENEHAWVSFNPVCVLMCFLKHVWFNRVCAPVWAHTPHSIDYWQEKQQRHMGKCTCPMITGWNIWWTST